nr:uncharacterized protein LOC129384136 isoform X2 [Dermacentor andersoni]
MKMTVATPISWYRYTRMVSNEDSVRNLEARPTLSYTRVGPFTVRCTRRVRHTWRLNFRRLTPREERSCLYRNAGSCTQLRAAEFTSRTSSLNFRNCGLRERKSEVRIGNSSFYGDGQRYTETSRGCGEKGDYIPLQSDLHFRMHEWAHYRYGVFDENGTRGDSISGDLLLGRHAYTFVYTSGPTIATAYSTSAVHGETKFPETYSSGGTYTLQRRSIIAWHLVRHEVTSTRI